MSPNPSNPSAEAVRAAIDHPIIDADGHCLEYLPVVREVLRELAGESIDRAFWKTFEQMRAAAHAGARDRRALAIMRPPWWAFPAENTLDRATAMLPRLFYERLDELGIDFAVVYPTFGLLTFNLADEEVRRAAARAFNLHFAEAYGEFSDRLAPVACIPMHTPDEAIAELDHAVGERGLKTVLMAGHVMRNVEASGPGPRPMQWMDTFGIDSPYDYDPVWQRCTELGVSPTFHSSGMGWGSRASATSYVYNHIGNFAAAGEANCRALFLDGVAQRFPSLRFAFLEGGVAWAATLYSDIIGHYRKRNRTAVEKYDPERIDRPKLVELIEAYGDEKVRKRLSELEDALWPFTDPGGPENTRDEFERSGIQSVDEIRRIFSENFFFGCEADDPANATAFDTKRNPGGLRLNAIFSSDIGHWDVPDNREVLAEAYELVERGLFSADDFRAFTFENAVALYAGARPDFFEGTPLAEAAARHRSAESSFELS
ncbi:MAG: amidohydrolase family protein [Myxococcales bacterium]|nr:amidohydrolase family protein [Myxococcales bacterium]